MVTPLSLQEMARAGILTSSDSITSHQILNKCPIRKIERDPVKISDYTKYFTHTHTHTLMTHTCARTHTHAHTNTRTYKHVHRHIRTLSLTHTHTNTRTCTFIIRMKEHAHVQAFSPFPLMYSLFSIDSFFYTYSINVAGRNYLIKDTALEKFPNTLLGSSDKVRFTRQGICDNNCTFPRVAKNKIIF